tara:strand:+ start:4083 stop:4262 length:180 start_codon:yes stop_codon:yes gene_type:complete
MAVEMEAVEEDGSVEVMVEVEEEEVVAGVMGEEVVEAVDVRGIRRRSGEEDMRIVRVFV